ncbi:MAG: hypothetical protein Q7R33_02000 [Nitrosarchaeum sp.]|nr:hypothetical protein [Nitrosarchaeum sp.]
MAAFVAGYLAPGVYDRTLLDPNVATLLGGLRIPIIIGTGEEQKLLLNQDVIRGSSAYVDNKASNEDVSAQADGTNTVFQITYYPIVNGEGSGIVTNRVSDVIVKVNNNSVPVVRVDGTNGLITVQLPPKASDSVSVTYYFKLTDTKITDEDVSAQATGTNVTFYSYQKPIVDGRGSGTPTTTITDVVAKVNGLAVTISEVNGTDGTVILNSAPLITDTVTLTYWFNQYADTFDLLPQNQLTSVVSVGDSPDLNNYIEGVDFIIINGDKIQWGAGTILSVITHTSGSVYFDDTQISTLLVDDRIVKEDVSSQFTGVENSCTTVYTPIVDGNGRDLITYDPTKVKAYVNGSEVVVTRVDGATGTVYIAVTPVFGSTVEVSYWKSDIIDETYTLEVVTPGVAGVGTYKITTQIQGSLYNAKMTGYTTSPTPSFMDSVGAHLKASKNKAVDETVTLTFTSSTAFLVSSTNGSGSGSGATTSGQTGQTYVDAVTGLQFTITPDALYNPAETIEIKVHNDDIPGTRSGGPGTGTAGPFETGVSMAYYVVPGLRIIISNTTNTAASDTTNVQTFDKSGNEPAVGATYYMTYYYQKTDFAPKVYTQFKDITSEYGVLDIGNQISLTSFLMMINGAVAVMVKQILKTPGETTAPDISYINALKEIEKPISGIKPRVIHPVTTSSTVISALKTHLAQMSSERRRSERTAFIGFAVGTEPQDAAVKARAIGYSRIVAVYPDGAVIGLTDERGVETEYILDGSYIAATMVGLNVSIAYDVAEPMTRKSIAGFKRLVRDLDEIEMDEVAANGVTLIFDDAGVMKIRHALTTDIGNVFNKAPNIVTIMDEVQIQARASLDQYIGKKFLPTLPDSVASTLAATLSSLKDAEIISDYTSVSAVASTTDPNYLVAEAFYKPVFELSYIRVTFNIRAKL